MVLVPVWNENGSSVPGNGHFDPFGNNYPFFVPERRMMFPGRGTIDN